MEYPIVTICGSMRNYHQMLTVAQQLTAQKYIVLMPFLIKDSASPEKRMLDDMHKRKIDLSDAGIVVVGLYYGESTESEIDYCKSLGRPVRYWTQHFGPVE